MTGFAEIFKDYASDKDSVRLSSFITDNKKAVVLHCFSEGATDWQTLRTEIANEFKQFQEHTGMV
jgi:hypothetical protein